MKPFIPSPLRRAAFLVPAVGLMLAPLSAWAAEREQPLDTDTGTHQDQDGGQGGRAGIIDEFNFGPSGRDLLLQRDEGGTRQLSGRVIEQKGQTLYLERNGVAVPLDVSLLRIHKQPRQGQEVIASYEVQATSNIALTLAGEVEPPAAD